MGVTRKPDNSDQDQEVGGKAILNRLFNFVSREEPEPPPSPAIDAQTLSEMATLYERLRRAMAGNALDRAFELAWEIEQRLPGYRDVADILQWLTAQKVETLKRRALLAAEQGEGQRALELVQEIRAIDPHYQFCSRQTINQILKRVPQRRKKFLLALRVGGALVVLVALGFLSIKIIGSLGRSASESTSAVVAGSAPTITAQPSAVPVPTRSAEPTASSISTPRPSASPTARATRTPRPTPTAAATATPIAAAIVGADGAPLRPGATTWWYPRQTLPAGTELELVGYDPDFPDWVYVHQVDGTAEGWVQIEDVEVHRDLETLPRVTPRPTLTPTSAADQPPSIPADCRAGPLTLDAWSIGYECKPDGWEAIISVEGHGGDCTYTYGWNEEVRAGPMSGPTTFRVSAPHTATIVGEAWATSAGQTVRNTLFIPPPPCEQ